MCRRVCQQKCTAALQKNSDARGLPDAAAGELKSPHGSDELMKLLLERSAELAAAKAALVRKNHELADVKEKLANSPRTRGSEEDIEQQGPPAD